MSDLKSVGEAIDVALGHARQNAAHRQGPHGNNSQFVDGPEHDAPLQGAGERVVAARCPPDSEAACKIGEVDHVPIWFVLESARESTEQPRGSGAEDGQPEDLYVGIANRVSDTLDERIRPHDDVGRSVRVVSTSRRRVHGRVHEFSLEVVRVILMCTSGKNEGHGPRR